MIFLNYTKSNELDELVAKAIFNQLNQIFPDQIIDDLSTDNEFWMNLEKNRTNNIFIFLSSIDSYNDINFWKNLSQAFAYKESKKINKWIEIKIDNNLTPAFMKKELMWINFDDNVDKICKLIENGINFNDWKQFDKQSNFIYINTYYRNDLEKNQAVLVNENDHWDVIITKVKTIHDKLERWNYSIIADQEWIENFYSSKPLTTPKENDELPSQNWLKSKDLYTKTVEPLDGNSINNSDWQSFIFFRDVYEAYGIKKISIVIRDLIEGINYTIDVL